MRAIAFFIIAALAVVAFLSSENAVRHQRAVAKLEHKAAAPANMPQQHRLFAVCPWTDWAPPKAQGVHQV